MRRKNGLIFLLTSSSPHLLKEEACYSEGYQTPLYRQGLTPAPPGASGGRSERPSTPGSGPSSPRPRASDCRGDATQPRPSPTASWRARSQWTSLTGDLIHEPCEQQ